MRRSHLFQSATLQLTGWYLAILVTISLLFSFIIYQISVSEISTRLDVFESRISDNMSPVPSFDFGTFRNRQLHESEGNMLLGLIYANLVILFVGGLGSYLLAKRTLRPIEESHEAQGRFASDASHELRTPLAVMKSELEVALRDTKLTKEEMRELLISNLEEVNRLSDLSHALLQFTRGDTDDLEMKQVSLRTISKKVLGAQAMPKDRIRLHAKTNAELYGNEPGLSELLVILLDNALRYSPIDSKIDLTLIEAEDQVVCTISNSGEGIDPSDMPHVFERFYRGDHSRSSQNAQGYGLGLSLAKRIVELHDGIIEISSIPDEITSVTVTLPKISNNV